MQKLITIAILKMPHLHPYWHFVQFLRQVIWIQHGSNYEGGKSLTCISEHTVFLQGISFCVKLLSENILVHIECWRGHQYDISVQYTATSMYRDQTLLNYYNEGAMSYRKTLMVVNTLLNRLSVSIECRIHINFQHSNKLHCYNHGKNCTKISIETNLAQKHRRLL